MYAHAEKYHSNVKKNIQFVKTTVTYLKKQDKLNNLLSHRINLFFCDHACIHVLIINLKKNSLSYTRKKKFIFVRRIL